MGLKTYLNDDVCVSRSVEEDMARRFSSRAAIGHFPSSLALFTCSLTVLKLLLNSPHDFGRPVGGTDKPLPDPKMRRGRRSWTFDILVLIYLSSKQKVFCYFQIIQDKNDELGFTEAVVRKNIPFASVTSMIRDWTLKCEYHDNVYILNARPRTQ